MGEGHRVKTCWTCMLFTSANVSCAGIDRYVFGPTLRRAALDWEARYCSREPDSSMPPREFMGPPCPGWVGDS